MSIEQTDQVDVMTIENGTGDLVLTISDHLPWDDSSHLHLLQAKLNNYLAFVESGELVNTYPETAGRRVVLEVIGKYPLDRGAESFFKKASTAVSAAGFELRFRLLGED